MSGEPAVLVLGVGQVSAGGWNKSTSRPVKGLARITALSAFRKSYVKSTTEVSSRRNRVAASRKSSCTPSVSRMPIRDRQLHPHLPPNVRTGHDGGHTARSAPVHSGS
jgi:hypothetical protein